MDNTTLIILAVVAVVVVVAVVLLLRRRTGDDTVAAPDDTGRLRRTSTALGTALRRALGSGLDDSSWQELEEALLAADMGMEATSRVVEGVRRARPETAAAAREELGRRLLVELEGADRNLSLRGEPAVVLVVGVNGTGKTTTVAKLARLLRNEGKTVVLGAADTFRAAAGEQLRKWGDRVGVDVVTGQEGGDPAAVAHDTMSSARAKGTDVVLIDTAGRLHGKKNLMAELAKIHRVASGEGSVAEVLLVLDATAGQNGLAQVREFANAVPLSGLVLTKLDGTAKGGIVIAVEKELGVPVKLIGLGEEMDDLEHFEPDSFIEALLEDA
jgi:fused signal recognition particle receptor